MSRKGLYITLLLAVFAVGARVSWRAEQPVAAVSDIQISQSQFARYVDELSEPEGYFDSDNFISNETSYLHVVDELKRSVRPGEVYLGVGPDQNFSYIVHSRPVLAVIFDIRRQNMLQHLLYKAVFDLGANRTEFLSLLFSRETPKVPDNASLRDLLEAVDRAPTSTDRYKSNFEIIRQRLMSYGLSLGPDDWRKLEYVYATLQAEGLQLRFSSIGRNNAMNYPTFESLMLETDRAGKLQGFLASEELFQQLKKFQAENRLIPVVGDFAGSGAFKAVAAFLKSNGLEVGAFYTSNVEFYLFGGDKWAPFVENVKAMPLADDMVFIRAYFGNSGSHPLNVPGHRSTSLIHSGARFLEDYAEGRLRTYSDLIFR